MILGSRDPGEAGLLDWAGPAGVAALPGATVRAADIVLNATPGSAAVEALRAAGAADLDGTVVLDVSNPLDFSTGTATVFTGLDDSVGERLQREFPRIRIVTSLCTVNNAIMVDPAQLPEPTTMFVAGDDATAKQAVATLLRAVGWTDAQLLDHGGIEAAREMERNILFWLRIYNAVGTAGFNIQLVRAD